MALQRDHAEWNWAIALPTHPIRRKDDHWLKHIFFSQICISSQSQQFLRVLLRWIEQSDVGKYIVPRKAVLCLHQQLIHCATEAMRQWMQSLRKPIPCFHFFYQALTRLVILEVRCQRRLHLKVWRHLFPLSVYGNTVAEGDDRTLKLTRNQILWEMPCKHKISKHG